MNILIIGSGGREHAFAWKLAQSPLINKIFVAPGNAGTSKIATNVPIPVDDFEGIKKLVINKAITLVVVGPEDPLVKGIHDFFLNDHLLKDIKVIGPQKKAAQLEGSKDFSKQFMQRHNIPTAKYATFDKNTIEEAKQFLESLSPPFVLKADGLAAGKGVLIIDELEKAKQEVEQMLIHSKFGKASNKIIIEEFLDGIELSCFVLTDGETYKILPLAKDYKRIGEGDTGLNTGGMGAISPPPFVNDDFMQKIENKIIKPTIQGLKKDNIPYQGFIFIGLMKVDDEPYVIEYNVRMGDPETEAVLLRITSDLLPILQATSNQKLEHIDINISDDTAATIMLVSEGYPKAYKKGNKIEGIDNCDASSIIFHAGTSMNSNKEIITNGGRVLAVSSLGKGHKEAIKKSFKTIDNIYFKGMYYRKDIGFDL